MAKKTGKCKACGNLVSKKAKFCPHCGEGKPYKDPNETVLIVLLVIVFGIFVIGGMGSEKAPTSNTATAFEQKGRASPPPEQKSPCESNFSQCQSQAELIEEHRAVAAYYCKETFKRIARYGEPDFPLLAFASFKLSEKSYETGILTLSEPELKIQNAFGAMENVRGICTYDLEHKIVTDAYIDRN